MKKNKPHILAGIISLLIIACSTAESDGKKLVLQVLKDPDSAKFGKFTKIEDKVACLTVNAKNSMGGYTGNKQVSLVKNDGKWSVVTITDLSHDECLDSLKMVVINQKPVTNSIP
jgi:hypothetical protein